jgi:hypothetical protein
MAAPSADAQYAAAILMLSELMKERHIVYAPQRRSLWKLIVATKNDQALARSHIRARIDLAITAVRVMFSLLGGTEDEAVAEGAGVPLLDGFLASWMTPVEPPTLVSFF